VAAATGLTFCDQKVSKKSQVTAKFYTLFRVNLAKAAKLATLKQTPLLYAKLTQNS